MYGLSLPGMIALPLGIGSFVFRRQWREICLCIVVPLLYMAAYGRSLYELRYLLPLAPFIAIAIAEGGRLALRSRGAASMSLGAAFTLAFAACIVPPIHPPFWPLSHLSNDNDGPRPIIGRGWSPLIWTQWLGSLNGGVAAVGDAVEQAASEGGTSVFVSTHWNPDRLLDLTLLEHGFEARPNAGPASCHTIAEVFTRNSATVVHVRTHIPFIPGHREAVDWQEGGLPCLRDAGLESASARVLELDPVDFAPPGTGPADGVTDLYRPTSEALGRWTDPNLQRQVYIIVRAPVGIVDRLLTGARTPEEMRVARAIFVSRTTLLQ